MLSDGSYAIIEEIQIEKLATPETTYNFEVEDFHTYYVAESKVLVHNLCEGTIEVTDERIRDAMKDAPLKTQQKSISKPRVQEYVDKLLAGEEAPPIRVDDGIIVDGNHRYVAGRIVGLEPKQIPWAGGKIENVVPWSEVLIDPTYW